VRPQEIVVTQRRYIPPQGTPRDSVSSEAPHKSGSLTLRANGASAYSIGTPEHSALVDAVRREFPEIFDSGPNCGTAESS